MPRPLQLCTFLACGLVALAADTKPESVLYELMINGESFLVETNRPMKLQSKKTGVTYDVALRVAQVQRLVLKRIQLDVDRGYEVSDDQGDNVRTATLKHELGYTIVVSDVGGQLSEAARGQVLETLQRSMEKSFREAKAEEVVVARKHQRKFQHAAGEGITIQYQDSQGRAQTCLVYVFNGKDFTASAIVQFQDADHEDVLPLIKATLDSVQSRGP